MSVYFLFVSESHLAPVFFFFGARDTISDFYELQKVLRSCFEQRKVECENKRLISVLNYEEETIVISC